MTEEDGIEPSRRQVFKRAHTKKDGTIVNSETTQIIVCLVFNYAYNHKCHTVL